MQIWARRTSMGLVALAVICLLWAAPQAQAQKAKSTQTEAVWVKFDPETNTVTVRVRNPGKGATPPRHLKLRKGREASFNVKPEGSVLTRTSVAINGRKGEMADIPAGRSTSTGSLTRTTTRPASPERSTCSCPPQSKAKTPAKAAVTETSEIGDVPSVFRCERLSPDGVFP